MSELKPRLSIIIPVFNESRTIKTIVDRIQSVNISKELIIVDDGSSDDTLEILKSMKFDNLRIFFHEKNQGKGAAIRTAIPYARGTFSVIQDGDLEYDPEDFHLLIREMESNKARVVYGSRILSHSRMSYYRYWLGGRGVTFITNMLYGSKLTDEPTCYKMFETELLKSLNLTSIGFEFCPEVTAKVLNRRIPIIETPISYNPRSLEEGKKIRWKDGLIAVWVLLKNRISRSS